MTTVNRSEFLRARFNHFDYVNAYEQLRDIPDDVPISEPLFFYESGEPEPSRDVDDAVRVISAIIPSGDVSVGLLKHGLLMAAYYADLE